MLGAKLWERESGLRRSCDRGVRRIGTGQGFKEQDRLVWGMISLMLRVRVKCGRHNEKLQASEYSSGRLSSDVRRGVGQMT